MKIFFQKLFFQISKQSIFPKKKFFKTIFFVSNNFFNFFFKNLFFSTESFFIKMLISLNLFIWHLSRRIFRIESAGKRAAIEKSHPVIGWKRIDKRATFVCNLLPVHECFLSAEGRAKSFDISDFKCR